MGHSRNRLSLSFSTSLILAPFPMVTWTDRIGMMYYQSKNVTSFIFPFQSGFLRFQSFAFHPAALVWIRSLVTASWGEEQRGYPLACDLPGEGSCTPGTPPSPAGSSPRSPRSPSWSRLLRMGLTWCLACVGSVVTETVSAVQTNRYHVSWGWSPERKAQHWESWQWRQSQRHKV